MKSIFSISIMILILSFTAVARGQFQETKPTKNVTLLIYYSGDNRLSDFMHSSYLRVLREGAGPNVNVLVQYDGEKKNDSFRAAIGEEKPGGTPKPMFYARGIEYDMGNPATLADFVQWGLKNFPARKTMLVISSHGYGVLNVPFSQNLNEVASSGRESISYMGASTDDSSRSFMSEEALVKALSPVLKGRKLDLLVHNSCLMGSLESLSILSSIANYAVASEYLIYMNTDDDLKDNRARTIRIENMVAFLKKNPAAGEIQVGHQVIADFRESYKDFMMPSDNDEKRGYPSTLALYDLNSIRFLAETYADLARRFMAQSDGDQATLFRLFESYMGATYVDSYGYLDLRTVLHALVGALEPQAISSRMGKINELIDQVVIDKVDLFIDQKLPVSHLHVFFPSIQSQFNLAPYMKSYADIEWVKRHGLSRFVEFICDRYEENKEIFWFQKLQDWDRGQTIIVKATAPPESYDYELFLQLDMIAMPLANRPGQVEFKKYLDVLAALKRQSPDLAKHRRELQNLLAQ